MYTTTDAFNANPFSLVEATAAINRQTYVPGQIGATGVFGEDGVSTTSISIENRDDRLTLVEPSARGGAGETRGETKRDAVLVAIPHYQIDNVVLADEVQGVREFGTANTPETVEGRINFKMAKDARDLNLTVEHQRIGAIKGLVTSKSGRTIVDLYNLLGVAVPAAVSLALNTESTDVPALWQDARYALEDVLDESYTGIHVMTGQTFHNKLWRHKTIKETFLNNSTSDTLRQATPDVFEWGNATWERYRTGRRAKADLGAAYIADNEARVFFKGVEDLFMTRFAPADYDDTVNTKGLPFYALAIRREDKKGSNTQVQTNPISICTRPETLLKLTL